MAVTAQSSPYAAFMRKIGYSVGLESTFPRLLDVASEYARNQQLPMASWQQLVHERWQLKNDNIGDFFNGLGIIRRSRASIEVLNGLDVLGVVAAALGDGVQPAARLAFLAQIIENDGEIFLNCLKANFEDSQIAALLVSLISFKRAKLFEIYLNPQIRSQIAHVVGIEKQTTNLGSASEERKAELKKLGPLSGRRVGPLSRPLVPEVEFSDDYFRKVPPRRREWAIDIELCNTEGRLNSSAIRLFDLLNARGCVIESGAIVLWPFDHEIARLRLNPALFEDKRLDYWSLVEFSVMGAGGRLSSQDSEPFALKSEVLDILRRHFEIYRGLNRPKAMLRREIPLTVAYLSVSGELVARGFPVPNLPDIVQELQRDDGTDMRLRTSRNSIGTISFGR